MSSLTKEQVAISVNDKLKALAKKEGGDMNQALLFAQSRYIYERILARLQEFKFGERWVIKGGVLMLALPNVCNRVTMDMDFSLLDGEKISITSCLKALCETKPGVEDGLDFELVTEGKDAPRFIREEADNPTVRAKLVATLSLPRPNERRFFMDVTNCEQSYTPQLLSWTPTLKGFESFLVRAYPWELAFAEKLHSVLTATIKTPRLRDYMDVIAMSDSGVLDAEQSADWLRRTFETREQGLSGLHLNGSGVSEEFAQSRQDDWEGTLARTGYSGYLPISFSDALQRLRDIATPIVEAAMSRSSTMKP